MVRSALSLIAGFIFGLGLVIGGMVDPAKVQNFLDVAGTFDPSLAFVMGGAVVVTFVGYRLAFRERSPLFAEQFHLPTARELDAQLVVGPALFGIGWGLSGFCPGPAITSLPLMAKGTLIFVPAMLAGVAVARFITETRVPGCSGTTRGTDHLPLAS
jgi:uncharacterized membrane protein YedE/YeeE